MKSPFTREQQTTVIHGILCLVLILVVLAGLTTAFGMRVGLGAVWWPIAGLWLAAGLAAFGLSVWVAGCLITTVPFQVRLDDIASFGDLLARLRAQTGCGS